MLENDRRRKVEDFISKVRGLHPNMEYACAHGSCYRFYEVLAMAFPEAAPYMTQDRCHVVTRIGDEFFDISGYVGKATGKASARYHEMDASEIKSASKWRYR